MAIRFIFYIIPMLLFLQPSSVDAHVIAGQGFLSGVTHPLSGLDHFFAIVAVGAIGSRFGGKSMIVLPLTFVLSMVSGTLLSAGGMTLPFIEAGIAFSVLFLGVILAIRWQPSMVVSAICISLFALFHGHSHGEGITFATDSLLYFAGLVLSTAILHALGIGVGLWGQKEQRADIALRLAGAAISMNGLFFFV